MEGWLLAARKGEEKAVGSRWRAGCWRQGRGWEAVRSRGRLAVGGRKGMGRL